MEEKSKKEMEKETSCPIQTQLIYQGRILTVCLEIQDREDGSKVISDLIKHPGAVALLPVDRKGDLFLIKQWRRGAKKILIEIPAGTLEPLEKPLDCAERELQEEIGFKPTTLIPLGGLYTAPGFCDEYIHLFLAKDLIPSPLHAEDTDGIDLLKVSLEEALALAKQRDICDSKTLSALFLYTLWLKDHSCH